MIAWLTLVTDNQNYIICVDLIGKYSFKGPNRGILALFRFTVGPLKAEEV